MCDGAGQCVDEGTARYDAAIQAAMTNAQTYGAVGAFERHAYPGSCGAIARRLRRQHGTL